MFTNRIGVSFSDVQHVTMSILKSSIPSHGIDESKNLFHSGIDFLQGIDSMDSVPRFLKSGVVNVITTLVITRNLARITRIFVLTATYELCVSRKSYLRGHPT